MGCDGGTIPTRDELVKQKKKPEKKDKDAELAAKWQLCGISQEELQQPIVSCELGKLYSKEVVLEVLLEKATSNAAEHIRTLKDVKELKLTDNPEYESGKAKKGDQYGDDKVSRFICPVTGVEMNGLHRFCYLWQCGCVMSEKSLKEVKTHTCHVCGKAYEKQDIIILNGNEEDVNEMQSNMEARRLKAKLEKKSKKAEKRKTSQDKREEANSTSTTSKQQKMLNGVKPSGNGGSGNSKMNGGESTSGSGSVVTNGLMSRQIARQVNGRQIQADPGSSRVYKSLFTSSSAAQRQDKAHWVTSNPFYMR